MEDFKNNVISTEDTLMITLQYKKIELILLNGWSHNYLNYESNVGIIPIKIVKADICLRICFET